MPFLHPVPVENSNPIQRLPGALDPYIKSFELWKCAADSGFDTLDNNDSCNGPCYLPARPTMFQKYGASYLYRTEFAFRHLNLDNVTARKFDGTEAGPAQINILFDGNGSWHGSPFSFGRSGLRYNTLFGDGHAKFLTNDKYQEAWATRIDGAAGNPCL